MECLIGIRGRDFVVMACDNMCARSVVAMKRDVDKTFVLSNKLVMAVSGDSGDAVQFAEYVAKNIQLYRMRNGYDLSLKAAVNFTRRNLAESLRSSSAYMVNLLIGGCDEKGEGGLYYMDYLASSVSVPFAVHGYGSFFSLSVLDRYYRPDMTEKEAIELVQKCVNEIGTRLVLNMGTFRVKVIDKNGVRELPNINAEVLPGAVEVKQPGPGPDLARNVEMILQQ